MLRWSAPVALCLILTAVGARAQVPPDGGASADTGSQAADAGRSAEAPPATSPPATSPPAILPPPPAQRKPAQASVLTAPRGTPSERVHWLQAVIDEALKEPLSSGAKVGISVVEVESGKTVYARNATALFNPASNAKLVTTAAALGLLGPEYRWKTVAYADGPLVSGELRGQLYLKGFGDPSLSLEDLWRIVSELWQRGLRNVRGDLAVDDSYFDAVRVGPGFDQKLEDLPFRAPNGALSLNYNAVTVLVLPGLAEGKPARIVIDPQSPYFAVTNEARTGGGGPTSITVASRDGADHTELMVRGRIRLKDPGVTEARRVTHPELYTANAFRALLTRRGIKLSGDIVHAQTPEGARVLVAHYSQPLGVLVRDVNKRSNNFMAEQILKTLGAETAGQPGTWQKGVDAVASFLDRLGIARTQYRMINGSGLYDSNRFTPAQLVHVLRTAYKDFRFAADFIGSLALAGADGTISHRMEGGLAQRYVRAKTGSLGGISCLSGYAGAPLRPPLAFAIFMNDLPETGVTSARKAQDQIAEALVAYLLAP